jgi:hypothetical protein
MAKPTQNFVRSPRRILGIILGACLLCVGGLFAYEVIPRYIVLPLSLPSDDYNVSRWNFPTYAISRNYSERYFVWRAEATLVYEGVPDDSSRQSILIYFDNQFLESGWTRSEDIYASCSDILPEAKFLKYMEDVSENGYVWYHRKGFEPLSYSSANESVCLAIWNTSPGIFNLTILTAKPSPLTLFLDGIDL